MTGNYNNNTKTYRKLTLKHKKVKILFVYPRNTKEFTRTPSEMSVHSRSNWNLEMLVFKERGMLVLKRDVNSVFIARAYYTVDIIN